MMVLALAASHGRLLAHDENIRAGIEFQVNLYTPGQQFRPSVALDSDGDFIVTWYGIQGPRIDILARRYTRTGEPVTGEFQVNSYTIHGSYYPSVAAEAGGDFVIAWQSPQRDGENDGVFARRFSNAGAPLGPDFQVNVVTLGAQKFPMVASDADGDFVVVWQLQDVHARRFSSSGVALGSELQINTATGMGGRSPSVAMDADGDFVVVWTNLADGAGYGVVGRRFSSAGAAITGELQVNTYTFSSEKRPKVAAEANGDFVVVWESNHDGDDYGIFGRRFTSNGAAIGGEFQVNGRTQGRQWFSAVTADADGDLVVVWESQAGEDGDSTGVLAQRYSSAGARVGAELQVNTYTVNAQRVPAVSSDADGDFVVAWQSYNQDGNLFGVFAQLFDDPILADVDGNGVTDPLTDGLLLLRYLFGFRGATLITGAVDIFGCKRCNVPTIEAYLFEITN
jgi:hypothetical protein